MRKYSLAAIAATAVTLLVCLLSALTEPAIFNQPESLAAKLNWILMRPVASRFVIPAVCALLAALALTRKISLGMCSLLTLVNLLAYGGYYALVGGNVFKFSAWFYNAIEVIFHVSPVWFAAILVLGVVEKKPVVWALSALGLAMIVFLRSVVVLAFPQTPAAASSLDIVMGGSLALIALLAVYDWVSRKRVREVLP